MWFGKETMQKVLMAFAVVFAGSAVAAPVFPLYFDDANVGTTRGADGSYSKEDSVRQQDEWEYLMNYKMFGATGIEFGNKDIRIPSKTGWFGTAEGDFLLGANGGDTIGGSILIGGDIKFTQGPEVFTTGPVHVTGNVDVSSPTNFTTDYQASEEFPEGRPKNVMTGVHCVAGNADAAYKKYVNSDSLFVGSSYKDCPEKVAKIRTNLRIPNAPFYKVIKVNEGTDQETEKIVFSDEVDAVSALVANGAANESDPNSTEKKIQYIDVPPYTETDSSTFDFFVESISISNGGRLLIRMQDGGRLTRIFMSGTLSLASFSKIQIQYFDPSSYDETKKVWTGDGVVVENTNYRGHLMFYTPEDITFPSFAQATGTDENGQEYIYGLDTLQGTFISAGKITIGHHTVLAGQILANYLKVDTDFDGKGFIYVPFDPPELDPNLLKDGKFPETDKDVVVPIYLDTIASGDGVIFNYCFDVKHEADLPENSKEASIEDFNTNKDEGFDTSKAVFPICGEAVGEARILANSKELENPIVINVKEDKKNEGHDPEILILKIFDLFGAVMPGGLASGEFKLNIIDNPIKPKFDKGDKGPFEIKEKSATGDLVKKIEIVDIEADPLVLADYEVSLASAGTTVGGPTAEELFQISQMYIDEADGKVYVKVTVNQEALLDYESIVDEHESSIYEIKLTISNESGVLDEFEPKIEVVDVNEEPTLGGVSDVLGVPVSTLTPDENLEKDVVIGLVLATDIDQKHPNEFAYLEYSIKGTNTTPFDMNSNKIVVAKPEMMNYELGNNEYEFVVLVTNCEWVKSGNGYVKNNNAACFVKEQPVKVSIQNVDEDPKIECFEDDEECKSGNPYKIAEHSDVDTYIAKFKVTDVDAGDLAKYTIDDFDLVVDNKTGDNSWFKLVYSYDDVNNVGKIELVVKSKTDLDYEKMDELHDFKIVVTDPDDKNLKSEIERQVKVIDINEAPVLSGVLDTKGTKVETLKPDENLPKGDTIGSIAANDIDTKNLLEFGVLEYSIVPQTGVVIPFTMKDSIIVVEKPELLNYELGKNDYEFEVLVRNCEWVKSGDKYVKNENAKCFDQKQTVKVSIQDVNEKPEIIPDVCEDGDPNCTKSEDPKDCIGDKCGDGKDDIKDSCVSGNCEHINDHRDEVVIVGVQENSGKHVILEYTVTDEDAGDVDQISLEVHILDASTVKNGAKFSDLFEYEYDKTTHKITVSVSDKAVKDGLLDYEALRMATSRNDPDPEYKISLVVSDNKGTAALKDSLIRVIRILDVNEPPSFVAEECVIVEGNAVGDSVGRVMRPIDPDSMSNNPKFYDNSFTMLDGNTELFHLEKGADGLIIKLVADVELDCEEKDASGNLKYNCDDKKAYSVTLAYGDPAFPNNWTTAKVPVTLVDVNEAPTIVTDTIGVDENSPKGTVVDVIKWFDVDRYDSTMVFSINDPSGCLEINSATGVVSVKADNCEALDFEKYPKIVVTVTVVDSLGKGIAVPKDITVNIHDVNEPPSITDRTVKIPEDTKPGTVIDTVRAYDPDTDPAKSKLIYSLVGGDTAFFRIDSITGVLTLKKELDYETKKSHEVNVRVTDGEYEDFAKVTINVENVEEWSEVIITKYDNVDSTWTYPDTVYTNKQDGTITWKQDGTILSMDTTFTKKGENRVIITYQDPHKDHPGSDTIIVFYNDEIPTVVVKGFADAVVAENIYTVVEKTGDKDTNLYVNKTKNVILVSVVDPDPLHKRDTTFEISVDLKPVNVSQKTLNAVNEIAKSGLVLNETPSSGVTKTVVNGDQTEIAYTEIVGKDTVKITYMTDAKGDVVKVPVVNAKGETENIEVITVSYKAVVDGKEVTISYQADAMTGEVLVKDASGTLMVSGASKQSSGVSEGKFTITFSASDEYSMTVISYVVDEKNNMVKNAEGDVGYSVTYSYTNRYGNEAVKSVYIVLDQVGPKVEILSPTDGEIIRSNFVAVKWTVNGAEQDTLTLEGLKKGANPIIRIFRDKAGNEAADTVLVIMKDSKDVEIEVVNKVTKINPNDIDKYYKDNEPEEGQTFAVSIKNPKSNKEVETLKGGSFGKKDGSGEEPYPNASDSEESVHLGPTLAMEIKLPIVNSVGGLATLDDLLSSDGMIPLQGLDAENSTKVSVSDYIRDYCLDDVKMDSDLSRINLYDTKMNVKIWVYTTLGNFVDYFSFSQEMNDPDFTSDAGMLQMYFEQKPDKDGYVRSDNGKLYATGAYLYKVEANLVSMLRCTLPPIDPDKPSAAAKKKKDKIRSSDEILKPFGYKRPKI